MSFLLDALRKSERQAQRPAAPTIHSPTPEGSNAAQRSGWKVFLPMVSAAFLVMWWSGKDMMYAPESPARADQRVAGPGSPGHVERVPQRGAQKPRPGENGVVSAGAPEGQARQDGGRTPMEKISALLNQQIASGKDNAQGASEGSRPPAASQVAEQSEVSSPPLLQPDARLANVKVPAESMPPRSAPREGRGQEIRKQQDYINYWELPNNIRQQMPEFRVSVLVYADQPDERFILMNGNRHREGDAIQSGLELVEIRRDGALFEFMKYRFLVQR